MKKEKRKVRDEQERERKVERKMGDGRRVRGWKRGEWEINWRGRRR